MKKFILCLMLLITTISFSFKTEILEKNIVPEIKYGITLKIYPEGNKFPTEEEMQDIAYEIKIQNRGYKNYFVHFLLPKMELDGGAFAVANDVNSDNPTMKVNILYNILEYDDNFSKYVDVNENGNYFLRTLDNPKEIKLQSNSTFTEDLELKGVNVEKIEQVLLSQGFDIKRDGEYIFLKKREAKFEQKITIFLFDEKPSSIEIVSTHFNINPNQEEVYEKLKYSVRQINKGIENSEISTWLKKVSENLEENEFIEKPDFVIRAFDFGGEKSIKISKEIKSQSNEPMPWDNIELDEEK